MQVHKAPPGPHGRELGEACHVLCIRRFQRITSPRLASRLGQNPGSIRRAREHEARK